VKKLTLYKSLLLAFLVLASQLVTAQFLVETLDTSRQEHKGLYYSLKKLDHIRFSGYMQPQYQVAGEKGIDSYIGGDFAPQSNNRFMLRRGRLRVDYAGFTDDNKPSLQFVFQFDGTERGVFIRDFWGRYYENRMQLLSFTVGMFARPFGYEVNLSSSDRESPERGRASQILMRTERDLGGMVSFESRKHKNWLRYLKLDAGLFNGQGLTAPREFDSYKDLIARASVKPVPLSKNVSLSAGLSLLQGGFIQNNKYVYRSGTAGGDRVFVIDSSISNVGGKAPRRYRGADAQLKIKHGWGQTELRAEYWRGTQTATESTTETPAELLDEPYYVRKFDAAFFYFLQNIINDKHQIGIKYDWYDPNTDVSGNELGKTGTNFTGADVRYNTWGFGYIYYINSNVKLVLWYDHVKNESTGLNGFTRDVKDDVFTARLQFEF
jgi:predicted porin